MMLIKIRSGQWINPEHICRITQTTHMGQPDTAEVHMVDGNSMVFQGATPDELVEDLHSRVATKQWVREF